MPDKINKFINSLDKKWKKRVSSAIAKLIKKNGNVWGSKKLSGESGHFRIRVGKIRIVYTVLQSEVIILDINWRGNVYKK